ncbi:hypothetical protein IJS77_00950 [bacterium]|nr:hypothetical protein [bacterium]
MKIFIKKLLITALILVFTVNISYCKDMMNTIGNINHDFTMSNIPEYVYLKNSNEIVAEKEIVIPKNSVLKLKTLCARKERRWHKSGYILTKLESFTSENSKVPYDISAENIYLAVRKYEPIDKKEAAILATEIIVFSGASYYAPGVDIAYFFTKGAILRKKHPNWFKAGVSNAYDNSIFWFWLKGKPIELEKDSQIKIQSVDENKIDNLVEKIDKYNEKQEFKAQKKDFGKNKKELKKVAKEEEKFQKSFQKLSDEKNIKNYEKKQEKQAQKELKKEQKKIEKEQDEEILFKNAKKKYTKEQKKYKKFSNNKEKTEKNYIKKTEKEYYNTAKKQVKKDQKELEKILKIQEHIDKNISESKKEE